MSGQHLPTQNAQRRPPRSELPEGMPCLAPGTNGRRVPVMANSFALSHSLIGTSGYWFKYEVNFSATTRGGDSREIKRDLNEIWSAFAKSEKNAARDGLPTHLDGIVPAFDGRSSCYTVAQLPSDSIQAAIDVPERGAITITISDPIQIGAMELQKWIDSHNALVGDANEVLHALHAMFYCAIASHGFPVMKKKLMVQNPLHFHLNSSKHSPLKLTGGVELWRAFTWSIKTSRAREGLYLSIDTSSSAYIAPGSLMVFVNEVLGRRLQNANEMAPYQRDRINKIVKTLQIETVFDGKRQRRRISIGLSDQSARTCTFEHDGVFTTVEDFFRDHYQTILQYADLPVVQINRRVSIPLELCFILPGNPFRKRLSSSQQEQASRFQILNPADRMAAVSQMARELFTSIAPTHMTEFGLSTATPQVTPIEVEARQLTAPLIAMGGGKGGASIPVAPSNGSWKLEPRFNHKLLSGVNIPSYAVVVLPQHSQATKDFFAGPQGNSARGFKTTLRELGCSIPDRQPPFVHPIVNGRNRADVKATITKAISASMESLGLKPVILFWIMDCETKSQSDPDYPIVKSEGLRQGVLIQAIRKGSLIKGGDFTFRLNLALKVNAKLGGINFSYERLQQPDWFQRSSAMIFGADITHMEGKPSIACLTASMDRKTAKYAEEIRLLPLIEPSDPNGRAKKCEVLIGLEDMVVDLLRKRYSIKNECPPNSIIFIRDGVSDGEWSSVITNEIPAFKAGLAKFKKSEPKAIGWNPLLTVLTTVKRHNEKFMSRDGRQNVDPGTVIDDGTVNPRVFEFKLIAHKALIGTAAPLRVIGLLDEQQPPMTSDDIEGLVHSLCYSFQRCLRAVSLPTPVNHAHVICSRARDWFSEVDGDGSSSGGSQQTPKDRLRDLQAYNLILAEIEDGKKRLVSTVINQTYRAFPVQWWL